MDPLQVFLIILVIAGIFALVELGLLFKKSRAVVEEVSKNANDTIEQMQPIIQKVDGMMDDLQPAVKQVQPLLDKAGTAVDVATVDMASLNDILSDVSTMTNTASNVTTTVSKVADNTANSVAGVIGKISGRGKGAPQQKLEGETAPASAEEPAPQKEEPAKNASQGYVTYDENNSDEKSAE